MRKVALSLAVLLAASFATTADAAKKKAAAKSDPAMAAQQNTNRFMMDASNPYMATSKPAPAKKMAKRSKKKMKKS